MGIWYYQDNSGIQHESYEAACIYYGLDTPAQCLSELKYWAEVEAEEWLDHCAAYDLFAEREYAPMPLDDSIPF